MNKKYSFRKSFSPISYGFFTPGDVARLSNKSYRGSIYYRYINYVFPIIHSFEKKSSRYGLYDAFFLTIVDILVTQYSFPKTIAIKLEYIREVINSAGNFMELRKQQHIFDLSNPCGKFIIDLNQSADTFQNKFEETYLLPLEYVECRYNKYMKGEKYVRCSKQKYLNGDTGSGQKPD